MAMVFNATFNNISVISWHSLLLVEATEVLGENHRPIVSHWQTLLHNVVSTTPRHEWAGFELTTLVVIDFDCINYIKMENIKISDNSNLDPLLKNQIENRYLDRYVSPVPCITHVLNFQKSIISTIWIKEAKCLHLYRANSWNMEIS
jgi:hypothetical protein